jgi:hypothetical protein
MLDWHKALAQDRVWLRMLPVALRRTKILIGMAVGVAVFAGYVYLNKPERGEPVYCGKSLRQWSNRLDDGKAFGISSRALPSPTARQVEAAEAIRAMGEAALPRPAVRARPVVRFKFLGYFIPTGNR